MSTTTVETTAGTAPTVGSVNLLTDVITKDRVLPAGHDGWAIRTIRPDFRSSRGYRYPFPGEVAKAAGPFTMGDECPVREGDGICAAGTWAGMASGGVPAHVLLLVAYKTKDVLGGSIESKLRLRKFLVVDVIDGARLLIESGAYANLGYANLGYADLRSADLRSANLGYANLGYADLRYADLRSANLGYADLGSADLGSADLRSANLRSANLGYANLGYADLRSADLGSADLRYANLGSANLGSADLRSANLRYADLRSANLGSADLRSADLRSANLGYADLGSADLGSADLRSANLRSGGASALSESYWDKDRWLVRGDGLVVPR